MLILTPINYEPRAYFRIVCYVNGNKTQYVNLIHSKISRKKVTSRVQISGAFKCIPVQSLLQYNKSCFLKRQLYVRLR
jgi:hypothetical protein